MVHYKIRPKLSHEEAVSFLDRRFSRQILLIRYKSEGTLNFEDIGRSWRKSAWHISQSLDSAIAGIQKKGLPPAPTKLECKYLLEGGTRCGRKASWVYHRERSEPHLKHEFPISFRPVHGRALFYCSLHFPIVNPVLKLAFGLATTMKKYIVWEVMTS
jgi:hypothetical protein